MLEQTFIHIPGVGPKTERELWQSGIRSWDDFTAVLRPPAPISPALRRRLEDYIPQSIDAVKKGDAGFFARLSALGEAWRLFPEFASHCVFLDIETTGLSPVFDTVTMVGLFDGHKYEVFIDGQNFSLRALGYAYRGGSPESRFAGWLSWIGTSAVALPVTAAIVVACMLFSAYQGVDPLKKRLQQNEARIEVLQRQVTELQNQARQK